MSVKEEAEQEVINKSVSIATLPFMYDPVTQLAPNRDVALKVYNQQVSRLSEKVTESLIW